MGRKPAEAKGLTMGDALARALPHWASRPGQKTMTSVAGQAALVIGLSEPIAGSSPAWGIKALAAWREKGLSHQSVVLYYRVLRRIMALNGVSTADWPRAPEPPRIKLREPLSDDDFGRLVGHLRGVGLGETADLAIFLGGTGCRVNVEALNPMAITVSLSDPYDTLKIVGKGGHEREVPVFDVLCRALLRDPGRLDRMRSVGESAHLKRWREACRVLGVASRLPTPHAVRHSYASGLLRRTGNLALVQSLMGHADPKTTARYIAVDMADKAKAMSGGIKAS